MQISSVISTIGLASQAVCTVGFLPSLNQRPRLDVGQTGQGALDMRSVGSKGLRMSLDTSESRSLDSVMHQLKEKALVYSMENPKATSLRWYEAISQDLRGRSLSVLERSTLASEVVSQLNRQEAPMETVVIRRSDASVEDVRAAFVAEFGTIGARALMNPATAEKTENGNVICLSGMVEHFAEQAAITLLTTPQILQVLESSSHDQFESRFIQSMMQAVMFQGVSSFAALLSVVPSAIARATLDTGIHLQSQLALLQGGLSQDLQQSQAFQNKVKDLKTELLSIFQNLDRQGVTQHNRDDVIASFVPTEHDIVTLSTFEKVVDVFLAA